jgi:ubiquinone biosynthesis protein
MVSVLTAVRDLARLREITGVLVRHGFGEIVARAGLGDNRGKSEDGPKVSAAVRARLVAQELGPTFIKLGQIASTRPDLLPADVVAELKKLQDDVPPVPFAEIEKAVERSLGAPLGTIFKTFEEKPLATASIGQVHRATIEVGGQLVDVVAKVQRPGAADVIARDLELLHFIANAIERAIPETRIYSPVGLVQQLDRSITSELDFTIEAENAERFSKNFEGNPHVRFPRVYKQVSSKHVLVLERFDGLKLDVALAQGANGKRIAKNAVGIIVKMIFEDGLFHADPHPGNIFLLGTKEEPVIGLIDLGMVGRLSPDLRDRTVDLMLAAVRKDAQGIADALYAIGRPTRKIDMREYRAEVATLADKYVGRQLKDIQLSSLIRDLVQGAVKYGLEIPPDFMLVGKALMTLESIAKQLDPNLDVFEEASPYFHLIVRRRYSPERIGTELVRGAMQLSRAGYDMPMQLREVLDDLRLGRLAVRTADPELPRAADRLGRRLRAGLVVGSSVTAGAIVLHGERHVELGIALLVCAALILALHVARDRR